MSLEIRYQILQIRYLKTGCGNQRVGAVTRVVKKKRKKMTMIKKKRTVLGNSLINLLFPPTPCFNLLISFVSSLRLLVNFSWVPFSQIKNMGALGENKDRDKLCWERLRFHNRRAYCCVREGSFTVTKTWLWVPCFYSCHTWYFWARRSLLISLNISLSYPFLFLASLPPEETFLPVWL